MKLYRSSQPYATMKKILCLSEDGMFYNVEDKVDGEESSVELDKYNPLHAAHIFYSLNIYTFMLLFSSLCKFRIQIIRC